MGKIVGVISIKGGVGKTSTVVSLGATLSNNFKKRVLVVDANFSAPNLGMYLGIENPENTINDVLKDEKEISKVINKWNELDVIPASAIGAKIENPFKLREKLRGLKELYDIILIDSSPSLNEEILATMIASDELIVVTTPDKPTLESTVRAIEVAKKRKTPIIGLILNRVYGKKFELSMDDVEKEAGVPVLALIPHDLGFLEVLSKNNAITTSNKINNTTVEFNKLAALLVNDKYSDPRFFNRIKSTLFKKHVPKQDVNRDIFKNSIIDFWEFFCISIYCINNN